MALNCGRWDYIYSFIKAFNHREDFVLPDRAQVTMGVHFLRSAAELVVALRRERFTADGLPLAQTARSRTRLLLGVSWHAF